MILVDTDVMIEILDESSKIDKIMLLNVIDFTNFEVFADLVLFQ